MIYISNPTDSIAVLCVLVLNHYVWLEIIRINRYQECKYIFGFFSLLLYICLVSDILISRACFFIFVKRYAQVFVKYCSYFLKMNLIRCSLVCFCQEIFKKVCVWLYIKKYNKTCKTLRPIKSAMWRVIYLQNKTLIQIKKEITTSS